MKSKFAYLKGHRGGSVLWISISFCLLNAPVMGQYEPEKSLPNAYHVMDFETVYSFRRGGWRELGASLRSYLVNELMKWGLPVVARDEQSWRGIVSEAELGQAGYTDPQTAIQLGSKLNARYLVSGIIQSVECRERKAFDAAALCYAIEVSFQVTDITTGKHLFGGSFSAESDWNISAPQYEMLLNVLQKGGLNQDDLDQAIRRVAYRITSHIYENNPAAWVLFRPTPLNDKEFLIEAGEAISLPSGAEYQVLLVSERARLNSGKEFLQTTMVGQARVIEAQAGVLKLAWTRKEKKPFLLSSSQEITLRLKR